MTDEAVIRLSPASSTHTAVEMTRYPVLRDQVRSAFGFTHAPGGVLRLPPGWTHGQTLPLATPRIAEAPTRSRRRRRA